jgi:hypothetical protein
MATNSKGKFFLNDQLMRAHDKQAVAAPIVSGKPDQEEQGDETVVPANKIEVHKHPDKTYHTITHHDDGSRTREEHPDLDSVKAHEDTHFQDSDADQDEQMDDSSEDHGDQYR